MTSLAERRKAQQAAARDAGRRRRQARSQLKAALKLGYIGGADLIESSTPEWEDLAMTFDLDDLLLAIPGIGKATMYEIVAEYGCSPATKLGDIDTDGRERLAALVRLALNVL